MSACPYIYHVCLGLPANFWLEAVSQAREERRKRIEEMSVETRAFFDNIRFYKFYPRPSPGTPDISALKVDKSSFFVLESLLDEYWGRILLLPASRWTCESGMGAHSN